jgi:ribose transport system ATP-binding protein
LETADAKNLDKHRIIHTMLGHRLDAPEVGYESGATLPVRTATPPSLAVEQLSLPGAFRAISLAVAPGECLGLYGFVGAGHQELAHVIAGSLRPTAGNVLLDGQVLKAGNTHFAVQRGVVLVAADRAQTLVRGSEIYKNVTLAHLRPVFGNWLTRRAETNVVQPLLGRVQCRPPLPRLKAGQLSGGNQQKVVLAKWLLGPVRVLVLEEPTRGMDVGAKEEVMRLVRDLKSQGAAVILASTEPELLLAHADRILTFRRGEVTHEFAGTSVDKPTLMRYA